MAKNIELPFIVHGKELINEYLAWLQTDDAESRARSENDEQAMINVLAGLGGLIEYNLRAGYQHFARKNNQANDEFDKLSDLIDSLGKYLNNQNQKQLLKISCQIRNKLVHSDFPALYKKTKEAYEIRGIDYHFPNFEPLVQIFETTITRYGLNLNVQTGRAIDSRGNEIPTKVLLPGVGDSITMDFKYFYDSGHFLHVYDVLYKAYEAVVLFRYEHA